MIVANNNSTYYLNKLPYNPINDNKYVYLSGLEGSLDISNNIWYFDFKIFINDCFNIPVNSLNVNLITPFASLTDLSLVKITPGEIPDYVIDKDTSDCYNLKCQIDTSSSDYFSQKLINHYMNFNFDFKVNTIALDTATELRQEDKDKFINEFDSTYATSHIVYSNYYEGSDKGQATLVEKYYLTNDNVQSQNPKLINWTLNDDCIDLQDRPIRELLKIKMDDNYLIQGAQIDFNYSVEGSEIKTLTHKIEDPVYCSKEYSLSFPNGTKYDEATKTVVEIQSEDKGFFIPANAIGYYTITLLIYTSNNWLTLKLNKAFNFIESSSYQTKLEINQYYINNITYFKRMVI